MATRRVNEGLNTVFHQTITGTENDKIMVADLAFDDQGKVVGVVDFNDVFHPLNKADLQVYLSKLDEKGKAGL